MQEKLVEFNTAVLAKQKGFNGKSNYYYAKSKTRVHYGIYNQLHSFKDIAAPTQSLLQKWLREVHKILLWVEPLAIDKWEFGINYPNGGFGDAKEYNTYEEALEIGLQEALKLIK